MDLKRRELLKLACLSPALSACGGGGGGGGGGPTAADSRPNILSIALDDLNDWVGFLGHPQAKTPNMDALAARANNFRKAYCTVPVCSASRASLLSGLAPQHTKVWELETTFKAANPGKRQFDEMLAAAGYKVARYGKIDHQPSSHPTQPLPAQPFTNKVCPAPSPGEGAFDWGPVPGTDAQQPDYIIAQSGIDFLRDHDGSSPFCLSVGLYRTHVAWYVPQRFFDLYPLDKLVLPTTPANDLDDLGPEAKAFALKWNFHECITSQGLWASAVQAYLASISWVDEQIGRLLAALDASRYASNTVVLLWSDHGFHLGEKFHWHKLALWEHATRVPFLLRLPGQSSGRTVESCISLADVAPTLLAMAGVKPDYTMDGRNLGPLLADASLRWTEPVLTTLAQNNYSLRGPRWRYIRYAGGEQELYDEDADPGEYTNLAGQSAYVSVLSEQEALLKARLASLA